MPDLFRLSKEASKLVMAAPPKTLDALSPVPPPFFFNRPRIPAFVATLRSFSRFTSRGTSAGFFVLLFVCAFFHFPSSDFFFSSCFFLISSKVFLLLFLSGHNQLGETSRIAQIVHAIMLWFGRDFNREQKTDEHRQKRSTTTYPFRNPG